MNRERTIILGVCTFLSTLVLTLFLLPDQSTARSESDSTLPFLAAAAANEESTPESTTNMEEFESIPEQVVTLVNEARAAEGLPLLSIDETLMQAAAARAKEIVTAFSHTRPNGTPFSTILPEYNIDYRAASENLAWGQTSPAEVMEGWMDSPQHRSNILNPVYSSIGVGYHEASNGTKYWVQLLIGD